MRRSANQGCGEPRDQPDDSRTRHRCATPAGHLAAPRHEPYDYCNADKHDPQNEPDLIAPYTYLSTGQPWKRTDVVHAAPTLFTSTPTGMTGMTGNDGLGTMSAWNVLSSIGSSPIQPGHDTRGLSTPVFDRDGLTLGRAYYPRGALTSTAPGTSGSDRCVPSARTHGRVSTGPS